MLSARETRETPELPARNSSPESHRVVREPLMPPFEKGMRAGVPAGGIVGAVAGGAAGFGVGAIGAGIVGLAAGFFAYMALGARKIWDSAAKGVEKILDKVFKKKGPGGRAGAHGEGHGGGHH